MKTFICFLLCLTSLQGPARAETEPVRPDLDYFPSRLYAAIYRNWDIVPHERLAAVISTDLSTVRKTGKAMGLTPPKPLTPEEVRRNVEIVLRRNWPLLPRNQIEGMLGMTPQQLNEFLGKEIFLRALLSGQPAGLTPLKYQKPDQSTQARLAWFRAHLQKNLKAVAAIPEEPRLAYISELCQAHDPGDFISGAKPDSKDADLRSRWTIRFPANAGLVLTNAVQDFLDYCRKVHHVKRLSSANPSSATSARDKIFSIALDAGTNSAEAYTLTINAEAISLRSSTEFGLARGLIELERRMAERGGPFLAPASETNQPAFSPRYVSSYFSLLTDVLGQDVIDPFPDGYLNRLAHQDADGVWIYTLLEDLVPSPVFEGMGQGSEARRQRLCAIVNRAAKHGLKVYLYFNEPRAQFLPFFEKYPDVKGQPEGNTAALCTSTELVQKHLRGSFERLFREVPGLGGVFVITASENLANCYSHGRNIVCPRCRQRIPSDVVVESIRCMSEGVWAANPKAKFIVWDWSWHSVLGDNPQEELIKKLPKGVALMADFERGTPIQRGGVSLTVDEYAISVIGPSPRANIRAEQSKRYGLDYFAKIQLSTTWECGTVPFIPVPNLLARKAIAMHNAGVNGAMATWTIGSYPSPDTEAFAVAQWNPKLSEREILRRVAAKRYGPSAAEDAIRGWTKLSNAFTEEYPYSVAPYSGPLQDAPALPLYRRDIPPPFGQVSLLNPKDDWHNWPPPYSPDLMKQLLRHLCDRWDEGMKDMRLAISKTPAPRRRMAERDYGVAWMVGFTYRAYANALDFYKARDTGDTATMKRIAAEELKATTEAFRLVRADSRIGWEAELQYFYRPSDVMERLLSLDAVLDPMP